MVFLHTNVSKRKKIFADFFQHVNVKVKVVEKLLLKNQSTLHLFSECFLLVISTIVIYITFEIKYLYICRIKGYSDFYFILIRDILADGEKGFITARWNLGQGFRNAS